MNRYIATFYSHFDALVFFGRIKETTDAGLMPVPRKVSASCGTCCMYKSSAPIDFPDSETEAVYVETDGGWRIV